MWSVMDPRRVLVPEGYSVKRSPEVVIVHNRTGCEFAWRDDRWLHLARCKCWGVAS